jgi:AICAR transformylase/IMP cyclohydrolase PurH
MINMRYMFSSKKLSIADTAKVIQDKIMNITQVVRFTLFRTMLNNSVQSLVSVTVLPELLVLIKSKQVRWWSSDQVSEVWP